MNTSCTCPNGCRPTAVNAVGVVIEAFSLPRGWMPITKPFPTYCEARTALKAIPADNIERRAYVAFALTTKP